MRMPARHPRLSHSLAQGRRPMPARRLRPAGGRIPNGSVEALGIKTEVEALQTPGADFRALLLDLDGTLLDLDMDAFIPYYMGRLAKRFAHLLPPQQFVQYVLKATGAMINNLDPTVTNQTAFFQAFLPLIGRPLAELEPTFADFYAREFPTLGQQARPVPGMRAFLEEALRRGMDLVVATNPLFPREAIYARLRWAGLEDLPWKLVTTYEHMHFCKPHAGYFREIMDRIGREPQDCLMVGNDVQLDLPAEDIGLRSFLLLREGAAANNASAKPDAPGAGAGPVVPAASASSGKPALQLSPTQIWQGVKQQGSGSGDAPEGAGGRPEPTWRGTLADLRRLLWEG